MKTQFVLKERIKELIGEAEVKAALFYTFNFNAHFFENYVLTLLVPAQPFSANAITNHVIWRRLYKDGKVPPVTVYCDQYAKSYEQGPSLPYDVVEVNMPGVGKNKGNFHPKQSFILLQRKGQLELLVLTGSNNITQEGWCENKECISELVLINGKEYPKTFKKALQTFLRNVSNTYRTGRYFTEAEGAVDKFLNGIGYTKERNYTFYDSFQGPFTTFLQQQVLWDAGIKEVEIVSPFLKRDAVLADFFIRQGIKVNAEAPYKGGYCLLEETVFDAYKNAGVNWFYPGEDRNTHSKVYRFYSPDKVYTVVGSVNLTAPAWQGVPEGRPSTVYNIECAVCYEEKQERRQSILHREITSAVDFLPLKEDAEDNEFLERYTAPQLGFTMDWASGVLEWKGKLTNPCNLHLTATFFVELSDKGAIELRSLTQGNFIMDSLSRNNILEVRERIDEEERIHHYFFAQQNFEQKPIHFRLSATDILDAWQLLGLEREEEGQLDDWLLSRLEVYTELAQNESGIITQEVSPAKSLLNELAQHFYGLIKLEQFLFDERQLRGAQWMRTKHGNDLRYYLTHDNVDTLISYLADIEKLYSEGGMIAGYYWLLLSILETKFYGNPLLERFIRACVGEEHRRLLRTKSEEWRQELTLRRERVEKEMKLDKKKLKWAMETLNNEYASVG